MSPYRCIWCPDRPAPTPPVCGSCGAEVRDLSAVTLGELQVEAEARGLTLSVMATPAKAPVGPLWIHLGSGQTQREEAPDA